jgi:hypothetical protein
MQVFSPVFKLFLMHSQTVIFVDTPQGCKQAKKANRLVIAAE